MADPVCFCGHVEDEHSDIGECQVDDCFCVGWEEDVDAYDTEPEGSLIGDG